MSTSVHTSGIGINLRVQWRTGWKGLLAWVLGLFAVVLLTTTSITGLYDTPAKLRSYTESTATPALRMLNGAVAGMDTLGGVLVHAVGAWHLTNGDDIDMHGLGRPVIQSGRPVVDVGTFAPAPAPSEVVGEFDTAYRPGHENE